MNREDAKSAKEEERRMREFSDDVERLSYAAIGAAIEVHRVLGPGFLERVYHEALAVELRARGIPYKSKYVVSVRYKGHPVGESELDFLIGDAVVVELKAVEKIAPIHEAQVLSYLKTTQKQLGLIINFNVPILKEGIKRIALSSSSSVPVFAFFFALFASSRFIN